MTSSEPDPDTAETPRDVDPQGEPARAEAPPEEAEQPAPADAAASVRRTGSVGPLLCLGAAVLTVIGSIMELITAKNLPGPDNEQTISFTSWTTERGVGTGLSQPIPLNGLPLVGAAAILLVAAVLWMLAASRSQAARLRSLVAVATAVGAAFLAGTVTTIGVQMSWWMDLFAPPGLEPPAVPTVTIGPGFWMLVAAVGLAVMTAVLAWRPSRTEPAPAEPVPAAAATPEVEPAVAVRRLPDAPPDDPPATQGS